MIVWMVADRALDIIGLATLIYWAWRASKWWNAKDNPPAKRSAI